MKTYLCAQGAQARDHARWTNIIQPIHRRSKQALVVVEALYLAKMVWESYLEKIFLTLDKHSFIFLQGWGAGGG